MIDNFENNNNSTNFKTKHSVHFDVLNYAK